MPRDALCAIRPQLMSPNLLVGCSEANLVARRVCALVAGPLTMSLVVSNVGEFEMDATSAGRVGCLATANAACA